MQHKRINRQLIFFLGNYFLSHQDGLLLLPPHDDRKVELLEGLLIWNVVDPKFKALFLFLFVIRLETIKLILFFHRGLGPFELFLQAGHH